MVSSNLSQGTIQAQLQECTSSKGSTCRGSWVETSITNFANQTFSDGSLGGRLFQQTSGLSDASLVPRGARPNHIDPYYLPKGGSGKDWQELTKYSPLRVLYNKLYRLKLRLVLDKATTPQDGTLRWTGDKVKIFTSKFTLNPGTQVDACPTTGVLRSNMGPSATCKGRSSGKTLTNIQPKQPETIVHTFRDTVGWSVDGSASLSSLLPHYGGGNERVSDWVDLGAMRASLYPPQKRLFVPKNFGVPQQPQGKSPDGIKVGNCSLFSIT